MGNDASSVPRLSKQQRAQRLKAGDVIGGIVSSTAVSNNANEPTPTAIKTNSNTGVTLIIF